MRRLLFVLLFALVSLSANASYFSNIYFFGDSLTDVGNVHNLSSSPSVSFPYDEAGRASNGPIYADYLAQGLGFSATPSTTGGNNYAFGGARTRYQLFGPPFLGILDQINTFTGIPGSADSQALYVVWGGSNNLQDLIIGKKVDALGNPIPNLFSTVTDLISGIQSLYDDGARTFLVPNAPDLGLTPRISEYGSQAVFIANLLSLQFNELLSLALTELDETLADIEIIAFDTFGALNDIVANPADYGLTDTTHRCYTGDDLTFTGGGTVCSTPESYLFWDEIHPTTTAHAIIGREMLAAIPEPGSMLLIAIALLTMGLVSKAPTVSTRIRSRHS